MLPPAAPSAVKAKDMPNSPALQIIGKMKDTLEGRSVGILIHDGSDAGTIKSLCKAVETAGTSAKLVAIRLGNIKLSDGKSIDADGGNAFFQYQVPAAVITLKQGFGRLSRSLQDRGLLVLLDNRILKKQYGRIFVESLPNYKKTTEMSAVEEFFGVGL